MEFAGDKSLYDIEGGSDLELWDSDLQPVSQIIRQMFFVYGEPTCGPL